MIDGLTLCLLLTTLPGIMKDVLSVLLRLLLSILPSRALEPERCPRYRNL